MAVVQRSPLQTAGLALLALNLLAPVVDPPHPAHWVYDGAALLFEGWLVFIGWIMHFSDPLLPRTFTIPGTANFIFSTLLSVVVIVFAGRVLARLGARCFRGDGPAGRVGRRLGWHLGHLGGSGALWWVLDGALLALLVTTAVRLLG